MPNPGNYPSWLRWLGISQLGNLLAGGAKGGERRRIYFDLAGAVIDGNIPVSGTSSPSLEVYGSGTGNRMRIKWDIGDDQTITLSSGIPFQDMGITPGGSYEIYFRVVLSQDGTNAINEAQATPNLRIEGGGPAFTSPILIEWPQTLVPTLSNEGSFGISGAATVTDIGQVTLKFDLLGATADTVYLNEAYFEIVLKK